MSRFPAAATRLLRARGRSVPRAPDPDNGSCISSTQRYTRESNQCSQSAAAANAELSGRRASGIGHGALGVRRKPIKDPLPHVSDHVVEAPSIRLLARHLVGLVFAVTGEPSNLIQLAVPAASGPRPRGVFPLR